MQENNTPQPEPEVIVNKQDILLNYAMEEYGLAPLVCVGFTTIIGACIGGLLGITLFIKK